ncbi:BRO1-like domain-containing protein [Suillus clintonianus]|uniref:BRO1-like domain-containing protein n=1 Tax=Suillus clintonianus TaxID=1904413 RepID=UPI001B88227A|nr:BRO1-like domain-containing protein [Suillus clintonianus]KAG2147589.1 BRO1-like domain-containing protein [Suillus clintonianus]
MPNHLSIPFKKTYSCPIPIATRDYIQNHTEDHPDAYIRDINQWKSLRDIGTGGVLHSDRINFALNYHAQLVFILAKLPSDINLEFSYAHAFASSPSSLPVTLRSITFERASVLFNIAALYSQLAASEDRSSQDGLKRASSYYQNAAGVFAFLSTSALPKLGPLVDSENTPSDLTENIVKSLEWLMLAQAQECVWQRAVTDHYKNSLIAKLAAKVSSLYNTSLLSIRLASADSCDALPTSWIPHLETKQYHFNAASQFRKSIDELEASRYGDEIQRLMMAEADAKKGFNIAKRAGVAQAVLNDVKSLLDVVQKNLTRAERDNDLIYHQNVPAPSSIPVIQEVSMVQSIIPPGLRDPKTAIGNDNIIFGEMLGWGAREAINIYNDNKGNLLQEKIVEPAQNLNDEADKKLQSLNLPSSLEALERPVGLPPSLLRKAEEIRLEQGPTKIDVYLDDVQRLSRHVLGILDEAMDILDSEASEDEAARRETLMNRPPSHEANQELVMKQQRYRTILIQAAESDELVRRKWEEWEDQIIELTRDEDELEALVPSSTVSMTGKAVSTSQTQIHARTLRGLLESLDDIRRTRDDLVVRAQRRAESDDIRLKVLTAAASLEHGIEMSAVMFEDVSDNELAKYDKFIQGLTEGRKKQEEILSSIKSTNDAFIQSRKQDPAVKDREQALQFLDLAYSHYREIIRNLDEGLKFYNDMAGILTNFKEACKIWSSARSREARLLHRNMASLSIRDNASDESHEVPVPTVLPLRKGTRKQTAGIPTLSSADWEAQELAPPPAKHTDKTAKHR